MTQFDLEKTLSAAYAEGTAAPSAETNAVLVAALHRKQHALQNPPDLRISLWWLPMVVNLIVCGVPAVIFSLPIMPVWAHLLGFGLAWLAAGGVAMTLIGLKFSRLKQQLTIVLPRRSNYKEVY